MPIYNWKGISVAGIECSGSQTASSQEHLNKSLLSQGIALLTCSEKNHKTIPILGFLQRRTTNEHLVLFFEELELLINSGVEVVRALETIASTFPHTPLQKIATNLAQSIAHGQSFHGSLQQHNTIFPLFVINLIASGEKTGKLPQTLLYIKNHLKQQCALKRQLRDAALGPIVTLCIAALLIVSIIAFIVPYFTTLYQTLGKPIPAATQRLVLLHHFITSWQGAATLLVVAMMCLGLKALVKIPSVKHYMDLLILKIPIIKTITIYKHRIAFAQTMALFLQAGLPIMLALEQTLHQSTNTVFLQSIQTLRASIMAGSSLHATMITHPSPFFDAHFCALVLVGEQSGKLAHVLQKVADHTRMLLEAYLATLTTLCAPILLIITGSIIACLLMIIYLPIFSLGSLLSM